MSQPKLPITLNPREAMIVAHALEHLMEALSQNMCHELDTSYGEIDSLIKKVSQ